jgi:hypothetical protein
MERRWCIPNKGETMRKIVVAAAALAIPLSAATVGIVGASGTAGASSPVTCAKVSGSLTGTVHFKGCSTPFAKGSAVGTGLATGGTISWAGKHPGSGSVSLSGSVTSPGQGICATGSKEYDASDVVTAVTGSAASMIKVGDGGSGKFCVTKAGHLTLVRGSVFKV